MSGQRKLLMLIEKNIHRARIEAFCTRTEKYLYVFATCIDSLRKWCWHPFCFGPPPTDPLRAHDGFSSLHAAVLASASLPFIYPYVQQNTSTYWDGGLIDNNPIAHAAGAGCQRILVLCPSLPSKPTGFIGSLRRFFRPLLFIDNQMLRRLRRVQDKLRKSAIPQAHQPKIYAVTPGEHLPSGTVKFSAKSSRASFELGQRDCQQFYRSPGKSDLLKLTLPAPRRGFWEYLFRAIGGKATSAWPGDDS